MKKFYTLILIAFMGIGQVWGYSIMVKLLSIHLLRNLQAGIRQA